LTISKVTFKIIYDSLSKIKVIEYTGAPKLMHLKNPDVFVMWDNYIRGEKSRKYYDNLICLKMVLFISEKYTKTLMVILIFKRYAS